MSRKKRKARDGDAFIRESEQVSGSHDALAEHLAEEFLRAAVSGEEGEEDARDEIVSEELGGPFIETGPEEEFGRTLVDGKEWDKDTTPNPLPQVMGGLAVAGLEEAIEQRSSEPVSAWHASGWPESPSNEEEYELEPDAESPSRVEPATEDRDHRKP